MVDLKRIEYRLTERTHPAAYPSRKCWLEEEEAHKERLKRLKMVLRGFYFFFPWIDREQDVSSQIRAV